MKKLRVAATLVLLIALGIFFYARNLQIPLTAKTFVRTYPELTDPKTVTLSCSYQGSKLQIDETVYGSLDEYYKTDPKKYLAYYKNSNKDFVYNYEQDKTLDDLVSKIDTIGQQKKLNKDQTLDLAACFMQSIPYDESKATKILDTKNNFPVAQVIPRYPYETLYDFTGVCTDKSYLGSAILTRLGYANSLLSFDQQKHLSLGVGVPDGYGELGTNYGILELTGSGFLVGDIPQIKNNLGSAENTIQSLPEINTINTSQNTSVALANANRVEVVSDGAKYSRIVERTELRKKLEALSSGLNTKLQSVKNAQTELAVSESQVQKAEDFYKRVRTRESYDSYSQIYAEYQNVLKSTNATISDYNKTIKSYNQLVEQYKVH